MKIARITLIGGNEIDIHIKGDLSNEEIFDHLEANPESTIVRFGNAAIRKSSLSAIMIEDAKPIKKKVEKINNTIPFLNS